MKKNKHIIKLNNNRHINSRFNIDFRSRPLRPILLYYMDFLILYKVFISYRLVSHRADYCCTKVYYLYFTD